MASAMEQLRARQVKVYQSFITCSLETWNIDEFINGMSKHVMSQPLAIDVAPSCSCGRFFEQHPTIIEDTEDERLESFLHHLMEGHCKCLQKRYQSGSEPFRSSEKQWIHVAAAIGNLELFTKLVGKFECDINAETSLCHFTALSLAVMQTRTDIVSWLCSQPNLDANVQSKNEKHTPLIDAMLAEKFHLVDILITARGVDLNAKNFRGETPLVIAVRMVNARLVRVLLAAGADFTIPTSDGVLPVMLSVGSGHLVVREFIDAKVPLNNIDKDGETALTMAIRIRALDIVDILIRGGASCRANPARPALVLAASLGQLKTLLYLLDIGQAPNQRDDQGWSALHFACVRGHDKMVELLLDQDADVNALTGCNSSPLALAVFNRHSTVALSLIAYGCQVNTFDDDLDTPLHFATFNGNKDVVRALLDNGAEACMFNRIGATPLFNAVVSGVADVVKMLLPHYVEEDLQACSQGFAYTQWELKSELYYPIPRSMLWVAASNLNQEIVSLLQLAGVNATKEDWVISRDFPEPLHEPEHAEIRELLINMASVPRALVLLCRIAVRSALGAGNPRRVNQLRLVPRKVKNYISLRELYSN
ncbi:ankyrin-3 [Aplysia californica]|uniref:Ankyrin-3 n=1 Tax=Aplysia californica TaxID=6500 RepID=A0ABM0JIV6_APLCA|nr:ankyrin-3 [Aplysia californica]